jgi:hypothetical protein
MLDAGGAKEMYPIYKEDCHIKHIDCFEKRIICKLLNSPNYYGRGYSDFRDPERYKKNLQICRLIDEIRYSDKEELIREAKKRRAKIHYKGFTSSYINGGNASTSYDPRDKLDLGNAGSPSGVIFVPHIAKY